MKNNGSKLQGNIIKNNKVDPSNLQKLGLDNLKSIYISRIIEEINQQFLYKILDMD